MKLRAEELAALLAKDAKAVAAMLLPAGKEQNREWTVGSVAGDAGKSLKVRLTGEHAGNWKDFATGEGGDLLDLWAIVRGMSISEAMLDVKAYLGVRDPQFAGTKPKVAKPLAKKPKCHRPEGTPLAWLENTRCLSPEAIIRYKIAQRGDAVVFPYLSPSGELMFVKYREAREHAPGNKARVWSEEGGTPCLFGWQAIPPEARTVVICEGEPDALAWASYGYPALSVPNGANGHAWIEVEYDNLQRFDRIYLSLDMDDAGRAGVSEVITRLGRERCYVVELPLKDANECLMREVGLDAIKGCLRRARTLDPDELRPAEVFFERVVGEFYPVEGHRPGVSLPWIDANQLLLRPGEVSMLAGINGHGKSQIAGQITLEAMAQGWRSCVASLEFKPHKWLTRITRQACGLPLPSHSYIRRAFDWYDGKLWVFDVTGTAKINKLMEVCEYAARRHSIRFFVIDNLSKLGIDAEDRDAEKQFIDRLTDFARDFDVHVLLVHHVRKPEGNVGENKPPSKMDVKGSGSLTDMIDTLLVVWRNKPKERDLAEHARAQADLPPDVREPHKAETAPDGKLSCHKQRNGDAEPSAYLWFDQKSYQYVDRPNRRPYTFIPDQEAPNGHSVD